MKNKLRKKFLKLRRKYYFDLNSNQINKIYIELLKIIKKKKIKIIGSYQPINDELNVNLVLEKLKQNIKIALPRIQKKNNLEFRIWNRYEPLYINHLGIAEPSHKSKKVIPQLFLTPLLAFDLKFNRLGYGKGYYDRYFSKNKKFLTYGVAFSFQKCRVIYNDYKDIPLKGIITEKEIMN